MEKLSLPFCCEKAQELIEYSKKSSTAKADVILVLHDLYLKLIKLNFDNLTGSDLVSVTFYNTFSYDDEFKCDELPFIQLGRQQSLKEQQSLGELRLISERTVELSTEMVQINDKINKLECNKR